MRHSRYRSTQRSPTAVASTAAAAVAALIGIGVAITVLWAISPAAPVDARSERAFPGVVGSWFRSLVGDLGAQRPAIHSQAGSCQNLDLKVSVPDQVDNGGDIVYTLTLTNPNASADTHCGASDLLIYNTLPGGIQSEVQGALRDVRCSNSCELITTEKQIVGPIGDSIVVTVTNHVSWTIPSILPGASLQRTFWGRVTGQGDGAVFTNTTQIAYRLDGRQPTKTVLKVTKVFVPPTAQGETSVSAEPTWLSSDMGGTMGMDWGDYDGDGDLDLALGSTLGATVYENRHGTLVKLDAFEHTTRTLGLRWADFDNDDALELVAVGDTQFNYVYRLVGHTFVLSSTFEADAQLVRIEPGDYDGDGEIELVASTNSINAQCPVRLYQPDTTGVFSRTLASCFPDEKATAALRTGDYDNDGDLDLVVGEFPNAIRLWINGGATGGMTVTQIFTGSTPITPSLTFLPYAFDWGDYDADGYLDLAAAFPLDRKVVIYRNDQGRGFTKIAQELRTILFRTPLDIAWGDFDGDGLLDLAVMDTPPVIYRNTGDVNQPFTGRTPISLSDDAIAKRNQIWSTAAVDYDLDGDLDLALGNRDTPSALFTTFTTLLNPTMRGIAAWSGGSVTWGDVNGDGWLDLLYGAAEGSLSARLYTNQAGAFPASGMRELQSAFIGPHSVAFGDLDGDRRLDIALSTNNEIQIYLGGNTGNPNWTADKDVVTHDLAWGDADDDGDLDLLVGNDGENMLYLNQQGRLILPPEWVSPQADGTRSVAWGDVDNDRYLDIVVGNWGAPNRVYRNNRDRTFSLAWEATATYSTTSVALADYDGDGYLDLAVGNYGQPNLVYRNVGGVFGTVPEWTSAEYSRTTSLAWGDWDNDGDLDLAVGNYGEADQVYVNRGAMPMLWVWSSATAGRTTGVAWGDADRDGDLDLAVSQGSGGQIGVHENGYVMPAHLASLASSKPLPNNPSYVFVKRPGSTPDAYGYSSAEIVGGASTPTVTIAYRLYDPDAGQPAGGGTDTILATTYEYSLNGGGSWHQATPSSGTGIYTMTARLGEPAEFLWDARADGAVSNNARFRITIVHKNRVGPVQRASTSAVSPPFQVRGTACVWPQGADIQVTKLETGQTFDPEPDQSVQVEAGDQLSFNGELGVGRGQISFSWDFGDGGTAVGQGPVVHGYVFDGVYTVKLIVTAQPSYTSYNCPLTTMAVATQRIVVGTGVPGKRVFLPQVYR